MNEERKRAKVKREDVGYCEKCPAICKARETGFQNCPFLFYHPGVTEFEIVPAGMEERLEEQEEEHDALIATHQEILEIGAKLADENAALKQRVKELESVCEDFENLHPDSYDASAKYHGLEEEA